MRYFTILLATVLAVLFSFPDFAKAQTASTETQGDPLSLCMNKVNKDKAAALHAKPRKGVGKTPDFTIDEKKAIRECYSKLDRQDGDAKRAKQLQKHPHRKKN